MAQYTVTENAPPKIYGQAVTAGTPITLTPRRAAYFVRIGALVPTAATKGRAKASAGKDESKEG